ncbi:SDR family NAD(P)-dependent oxidoreductase [Chitinophaga defluvii]|uniref:SDR family oxidoreductase n=1 Tax=Chitinophaga defluvii TaxID=3163343 RepID=A0ABV2T5G9_9BACT
MAKKSFESKVAIVTGAGQGIGFEIARQLVAEGASVILNDLDPDLAAAAEKSIRDAGGNCTAVAGNTADDQIISAMINTAVKVYGRLDIVIANAGITLFGDFLDYPRKSFQAVLDVNLGGTFFLAQAAAQQMNKQGSGGSLLFTSSVTGHQAHKGLAAYGMTKAALEMLAKNLVIELSPHQINVNTVAPGATLTERTLEDANYEKVWSGITPMGRPASTLDIANAVLFMVSDKARHITGQSLVVDGGWTAVSPPPY